MKETPARLTNRLFSEDSVLFHLKTDLSSFWFLWDVNPPLAAPIKCAGVVEPWVHWGLPKFGPKECHTQCDGSFQNDRSKGSTMVVLEFLSHYILISSHIWQALCNVKICFWVHCACALCLRTVSLHAQ